MDFLNLARSRARFQVSKIENTVRHVPARGTTKERSQARVNTFFFSFWKHLNVLYLTLVWKWRRIYDRLYSLHAEAFSQLMPVRFFFPCVFW